MSNYCIEGNINFYDELYKKSTDDDDGDTPPNKDDDNVCLISGDALHTGYVTLDCKHRFNYLPLFKDLVNYKQKFSYMETPMVKSSEIRCPYCRNKQYTLLEYNAALFEKVHGVNWLDPEIPINKSDYIAKGMCSSPECSSGFCNIYTFAGDNKKYCFLHCTKLIKKQQQLTLQQKGLQLVSLQRRIILVIGAEANVICTQKK